MQKQGLIIVLVIVAVLIGYDVATRKAHEPILKDMYSMQGELLQTQKMIDEKLSQKQTADVSEIARKQQDLEQRITALENQMKGIAAIFTEARKNAGPTFPSDEYTKVHQIEVGYSPVRGEKNAPVTIVEFADMQCPFCRKFHPAIQDVLKNYPGKVNYILKNFPLSFHPNARPAAKAALAAGEQGKYFEMTDLILENNNALSDEKYLEFAKQLGLNIDKFKEDIKNKDDLWEKYIAEDMDLGAKTTVQGTPTFFLNGRKTQARDLNSFKQEIDPLLEKAQ